MHTAYAERVKASAQRVETMPQEVAALDARLERLRERLPAGDPDMTADELQATIERVEAKRRELISAADRTIASDVARIISLLPKAAEYYGQQISLGLDGDPRAAAKARPIVRELLGGKVQLVPGEDGTLWAEYGLQMSALLQGAGTCGRGEALHDVPAVLMRIRVRLMRHRLASAVARTQRPGGARMSALLPAGAKLLERLGLSYR